MDTEKLAILDADRKSLGVMTRKEVHAQGHWHETFHCWFTRREGDTTYLLFQRRALQKKDFPGKLDITAAGHLLAGEEVAEGIREVEEELGITLSYYDLQPVGIIKEQIILGPFIDREFCHIYLYSYNQPIERFVLQANEVAGMFQIEVDAFAQLIDECIDIVHATGYSVATDGSKSFVDTHYSRDDFCPHSRQYFLGLIEAVKR